ncbi:MAG: hypothetical protein HYX51_03345 [Chloroflexi bacterium]|nr:hypothetical protein [Chloroflexota bacterium]
MVNETSLFGGLLLLCQILITLVLLVAATAKLLDSRDFYNALEFSGIPSIIIRATTIMTPVVEVVLAAGIIVSKPNSLRVVMAGTSLLFLAFTVWSASIVARGLRLSCGCFGTSDDYVNIWSVVRNAGLTMVAILALFFGTQADSPIPAASFEVLAFTTALFMVLMLARAFRLARCELVLTIDELLSQEAL